MSARTVGTKTLAENVRILQRTAEGLKTIGLSQITTATVPKSDISYVGQDWAGRVNVLVIGGANNSVVLYGRTVVREETTGSGEDADTIRTIAVEYGVDQTFGPITTNYEIPNGAFVKATLNAAGTRYTGLRELTGLKKVPASAWIGTTAVTFGARTYTVAEDVACYNQATGTWMTLAAARAYSDTLNLYVENGAVRVVEIPK